MTPKKTTPKTKPRPTAPKSRKNAQARARAEKDRRAAKRRAHVRFVASEAALSDRRRQAERRRER